MRIGKNRTILLITLASIAVIVFGFFFVRVGPLLFDDIPKVQPDSPMPVAADLRPAMVASSLHYLEPIEVPKPAPEKPRNNNKVASSRAVTASKNKTSDKQDNRRDRRHQSPERDQDLTKRFRQWLRRLRNG